MADSDKREPLRIWVLTNAPSPYQVEYLQAVGACKSVEVAVRLMRPGYEGMAWSSPAELPHGFEVMPAWGGVGWRDELRFHPQAIRAASEAAYDIYVLSGMYTSPTFQAMASKLHRKGLPWAMWLEQPWPENYRPAWASRASTKSGLLRSLRRSLLGRLLHRTNGVFCIGEAAVEAYAGLGADRSKLFNVPYTCDVRRFGEVRDKTIDGVRVRYGLDSKVVYLFSGMLVERKGVDVALQAFERLGAERDDAALVILGDGPLRASLEKLVPEALRKRVHFAGRVSQDELPSFFAAADVFVFPSRHDGWGVVVNEACGAGLPLIVSEAVGAAQDLVESGKNGCIVARDDVHGFYEKMLFFAEHAAERKRFGAHSLERSRQFSLDVGVKRFLDAAQRCIDHRRGV